MGTRGRGSSDRMRTIWTSEMDRYFIDLMLEQVNKGNRILDNLFSKSAWKHMMSLFNSKFQFNYEKDVLKNRHKTLRNLYKAIRNLLDQKGFSWDETRKMVTADNKIWDEYIKVHPDARSYRIKTIPYYSDLCVIYDSSTRDGKNIVSGSEAVMLLEGIESPDTTVDDGEVGDDLVNSSSVAALHEIMVDQDYDISATRRTVDDITPEPTMDFGSTMCARTRTYWQPPMDRYFIDLMLDHVTRGNQADGLFHKQTWMDMIASFNAKFGFDYDIDVLKNRYKTLRRQFNVITHLLGLDGFVWDETRQMVTADDCVWQDYIKGHKDARQYMTRPVPYYKDLRVICGENVSGGRNNVVDKLVEVSMMEEEGIIGSKKYSKSPGASFSIEDVQESSDFRTDVSDKKQHRHELENPEYFASQNKKARVKDEGQGVANALREMASAVFSLSDKKEESNNSGITVSIENVIGAIQALPDMDEELVLDACDFLEDEKKAKTFLALDVKLRKKWLIRKLRPTQEL